MGCFPFRFCLSHFRFSALLLTAVFFGSLCGSPAFCLYPVPSLLPLAATHFPSSPPFLAVPYYLLSFPLRPPHLFFAFASRVLVLRSLHSSVAVFWYSPRSLVLGAVPFFFVPWLCIASVALGLCPVPPLHCFLLPRRCVPAVSAFFCAWAVHACCRVLLISLGRRLYYWASWGPSNSLCCWLGVASVSLPLALPVPASVRHAAHLLS